MEKLNIYPLNIETDLPEIKFWEEEFRNDPKFDSIKHFILEDSTYYGLDEVILTNYEFFHIGNDEKKFVLSIKNEKNKTVGFILACAFNLSINKPELIIQYIVLNPNYQNIGFGSEILKELLNNSQKYFDCQPQEFLADIEKNNHQSLYLFKKFGFSFSMKDNGYLRANKKTHILEEEKI